MANIVNLDKVGKGYGAAGQLLSARRAIEVSIAGATRIIAVEDAPRYRDGLGTPLPQGLPAATQGTV